MTRKLTALAVAVVCLTTVLSAAERIKVALDQIQSDGQSLAQTQTALGNFLAGELKRARNVALVSGSELAEALKKGQAASITDKDAAVAAGKLAKAGAVVWGRMSDSGQKLSFWLRMVDVKSGKMLFAKSFSVEAGAEGARREFERNIVSIAQDLVATAAGTNKGLSELRITVVGGANVSGMDAMSTPDVYATVQVGDEIVGTTGFRQNNANPSWNETFTAKYRGEKIKLSFFDRDLVKDEYIGSCVLDGPKSGTYDIAGRHLGQAGKRGTVTLKFEVKPFQPVEE
jgi:hypothetical protein